VPAEPTKASQAEKKTENADSRPLSVTVVLTKGTQITGAFLDSRELPLQTAFGEVKISLSEVAGVRFAREGSPATTVVLHNGDSVTGATDLTAVHVETEWGRAMVHGPNVSAVLFARGVKWVSEKDLTGTRWKLTSIPPAQPQPARPQPGVRPGNTNRSYSSRNSNSGNSRVTVAN
jgi:hypothetical protein